MVGDQVLEAAFRVELLDGNPMKLLSFYKLSSIVANLFLSSRPMILSSISKRSNRSTHNSYYNTTGVIVND